MSKLGIGTGITPDDGNGDSLLEGAVKVNSNFNEIYSYFGDGTNLTSGSWQKVSSGINTTLNVGIGTTNPRFTLEVGAVGASGTSLYVNGNARVTGILTVGSSSITLNGSSNIINVGSGITINGSTGIISATSIVVNGSTITGAGVTSITAGSGISVNQSTGNVTITATGSGTSSQWVTTSAGIHTLSSVGIGTTNPTSKLTVRGGDISLGDDEKIILGKDGDFEIYSSGNTYLTNSASNSGGDLRIRSDSTLIQNYTGTETIAQFDSGAGVTLNYSGNTRLTTVSTGVIVGTNAAGVAHIPNELRVGAVSANQSNASILIANSSGVGIGTTNPTSPLTVKGNTSLETLNVSGVSTFSGLVVGLQPMSGGNVNLDGNNLQLSANGIDFGSRGNIVFYQKNSFGNQTEIATLYSDTGNLSIDGILSGAGVTVTGTTFTNQLSVSGVSTFVGTVFANDVYVGDYDRIFFGNNANLTIGYDTGNGESLIKNQTSAPFAIDLGSNNNSKLSIRTGFASTLAYFSRTNVELYESTNKKFETIGAGVTVTGTTFTNQLNVSGVTTTTGLIVPNIADLNGTDALLYFNNSQKFATVNDGISITGLNRIVSSTFGNGNNGVRITTNSTDQADIYHTSAGILNIDNYRVTGGSIALRVTDGSGNTTEQARITSSGVGIGTTNPTSKLTVRDGDISVGVSTAHGLILTSPNGTQYRLIVDNAGALSTVAV